MKKIALFMPTPSDGGVQRVMINLAKGFIALGYEVDMVLAHTNGKMVTEIPRECNVINLNQTFGKGDLLPILSFFKLTKYLKHEKIEVLIASPGFTTIVSVWAKIVLKNNLKTVLMVDNKLSLLKKGRWHHKITFLMSKIFYRYSNLVITAHKSAEQDLKKNININESKIKTIYHPLVDSKKLLSIKPKSLQKKDERILLGVGRLVKEKDFVSLVRAFKKVTEQIPSKLIIVGEGPERGRIEETIKSLELNDKVQLVGYVNDPYSYMKSAQLVVVSSIEEAFGNVIVEALSVGTPVVSTNCTSGGPAEILNNGEYGELCSISNIDDLSNKILDVLCSKHDTQALITRAEEFSIITSVKRYEEVINELQ